MLCFVTHIITIPDSIKLSYHDDPDVSGCTGGFTASEFQVSTTFPYSFAVYEWCAYSTSTYINTRIIPNLFWGEDVQRRSIYVVYKNQKIPVDSQVVLACVEPIWFYIVYIVCGWIMIKKRVRLVDIYSYYICIVCASQPALFMLLKQLLMKNSSTAASNINVLGNLSSHDA